MVKKLPPPQALRFQSQAGELSTRNWGRAREGSREGGRREAFPFPSSLAHPPLSQQERDVWNEAGFIVFPLTAHSG